MGTFNSCCIIDDDEFFAFNAKRLMTETGFAEKVLWYADGQNAIDSIIGLLIENIELPEVILLDLNMPHKNGWEFLDEFIALPQKKLIDTKIYIISSFVSPDLIHKAKEYKLIKDYLIKPLNAASLEQIIACETNL